MPSVRQGEGNILPIPVLGSFFFIYSVGSRASKEARQNVLVLRYGRESASLFIQMEILTEAGELATEAAAVWGHPSEPSGTVCTCIDHHFSSGK